MKKINMKNKEWFIPVLIIAANILAIVVQWKSMPDIIPTHFDLKGNAGGTMLYNTLFMYPLIGAAICFAGYIFTQFKKQYQKSIIILISGFCLILFMSTMVSLTSGKMPFFMLAEPIILLVSIVASVFCFFKSLKN